MNQRATDERWMRLGLTMGQRGLGQVWPNPAVGCVIVRNNRVVSRGWTQAGGRPHAEVHALEQAGAAAKGATAYVTLEPCAHTGQTGPCANALVAVGIARVVSATADLDKRVAGKGHQILRNAGVEVEENILRTEAQQAHQGFFSRIKFGRPMVTLKLASSLDGRIATCTGDSRWITGPDARRMVHMLRATHDAVLVGGETARTDDPDLTVRDLGLAERSPVRVVLDSKLRLSTSGVLAATAREIPVWLCHGISASKAIKDQWLSIGAELVECKMLETQLDMKDVLSALAARGITRLFVEGGGQVAASLLRNGFVDRLVLFNAGVAIGRDGRPNLGEIGVEALNQAPRFQMERMQNIGEDVLTEWVPA